MIFNLNQTMLIKRWVVGAVLMGSLGLLFLRTHSITGTFHADEGGVVLGSISPNRELAAVFREAAYTAQPPLDHIIREKIYRPAGDFLGISKKYPELFHRLMSLLWWILPLGIFIVAYDKYSNKNRAAIIFFFLLISSSEFLGYYLAEARHYSAIAAVFASMLIVWMQDIVSWEKKKYVFLAVAVLLPFLHMVSLSYWLVIVLAFFVNLFRNSIQKDRKENYLLLGGYMVLGLLILGLYFEIKRISLDWQHPSITNLNIKYLGSYLKWTIDWIFYGTPLYQAWAIIPDVIKNNLQYLFGLLTLGLGILFQKGRDIGLYLVLLTIVLFVWPATVLTFLYVSGMFTGERYSIAILIIILLGISATLMETVWKTQFSNTIKFRIGLVLSLLLLLGSVTKFSTMPSQKLESEENKFVKQNSKFLKDKDTILIGDTGGYSSAIPLLAILNTAPFKVQYLQCRIGLFNRDEKNTLKQWLKEHVRDHVLLLGTRQDFMEPNEILWSVGDLALYRLTSVNESGLCNNMQTFDECYLKCFRGKYPASADQRSIPGTAPHLDVHRP